MHPSVLPPLDVVGPTGEPVTVSSITRSTTVAELVSVLEGEPATPLTVDGEPVRPETRLVQIPALRRGAQVALGDPLDEPEGDDRPDGCDRPDRPDESGRPPAPGPPIVEVAVVAGPACAAWRSLPAGRHLLGRAGHAGISIDDPTLEAHAGILDVTASGRVWFTQLTGTTPAWIGGEAVGAGTEVPSGARLRLGTSVVEIRTAGGDDRVHAASHPAAAAGSIVPDSTDPWRRVVHRGATIEPVWSPRAASAPSISPPPAMPPPTGLIGAAIAAAGGTALALALGNPMFVLFAALGAATASGTWIAGFVGCRRRRRRELRARHLADERFRVALDRLHTERLAHHRRRHPDLLATLLEPDDGGTRLWRSRVDASGSLSATVGTGRVHWRPPVETPDSQSLDGRALLAVERCARLEGVPAPLVLTPGDGVAIRGPTRLVDAVARSIIVQLATWIGPADWQLLVVTRRPDRWRWAEWLPHAAGERAVIPIDRIDDTPEGIEAIDADRRLLVVIDDPGALAARTGWLRRLLSVNDASTVVLVDSDETVPAICRRVLSIGSMGTATWIADPSADDHAADIEIAGLTHARAARAARALADLVDPELGERARSAPEAVSLGDVVAESLGPIDDPPERMAAAIADRWRTGGLDPAPVAPIGMTADGRVDVDLASDGPHGLIAGTTGAGKSELLRTMVVSLAAHVPPEHLNFVLVDYKGGATFDRCIELPHTVGLVTDLDDGLAERALVSLDAELHRRERLLRTVAATDLTDYRARTGAPPIARLAVVVDEFASLATELPGFLTALVAVAQRGRSLGIHLVLATQRPAGVVSDDIRANTNLRLALRLHHRSDAIDVVGDALPSTFPRAAAGRAALRLGPDELVVFQAARCSGPSGSADGSLTVRSRSNPGEPLGDHARRSELDVTVEAILRAHHGRTESVEVHRPWLDPLPHPLDDGAADLVDTLDDDGCRPDEPPAIGVVDDPQRQMRRPLRWRPRDGSLELIGSLGSGTTSTLIAVITALCRSAHPSELHVYVVDARGDDRLAALDSLAHCAGVVRPTEPERLHRLLARLASTVDRRIDGQDSPGAKVVLVVDGVGSLRTALSSVERAATFELLQRVLVDGPSVGLPSVTAHEGSATVPVADSWVFHLVDDTAARTRGVRTPVAAGVPGRLRIASSGLEAQVGLGAAGLAALPTRDEDRSGPPSIGVLPERLSVPELRRIAGARPRRVVPAGSTSLLVGLAADDLGPAALDVPAGEHVLVVGAARTGVSTALAGCAAAYTQVEPDVDVVYVGCDGLDRALARSPARTVLVVDDAHRCDDVRLAEIVRGDHPGVTLLAGARADVVRASYGHWTREVARSRCGLVMASRDEPDGDVLGVTLPRRGPIVPRPGLAWIVDGGPLRQVQVAEKMAR